MPLFRLIYNLALRIWGNEELRWEGQYRGIPRCKKAVFRWEGLLTYTWIITEMNHPTWFTPCPRPLEGGTPGNSLWGCAARFSKSWPYFRPKNVIFHTRLQTRSLKSIPIFNRLALFSLFQALRYWGRLPSFLPFYFCVRAFSIRRNQLSRSLEHEQVRPD